MSKDSHTVKTISKVDENLQIILPKPLATQYGIEPGDEVELVAAGEAIRLIPKKPLRQQAPQPQRGWTRDDLYDRVLRYDDQSSSDSADRDDEGE